AEIVSTGIKAMEIQAASAAALAKVTNPAEAIQLQQQLAGQVLDAYRTSANTFATALTATFTAALKPLSDRYAELSRIATKACRDGADDGGALRRGRISLVVSAARRAAAAV